MKRQFVLIDDDPINNVISKASIAKAYGDNIKAFIDPKVAVSYIENDPVLNSMDVHIVVLLDINMPVMNGWDVLERFEKLHDRIKSRMDIFILSSSKHPLDRIKADSHPLVKGFLDKPLTIPKIVQALSPRPVAHINPYQSFLTLQPVLR